MPLSKSQCSWPASDEGVVMAGSIKDQGLVNLSFSHNHWWTKTCRPWGTRAETENKRKPEVSVFKSRSGRSREFWASESVFNVGTTQHSMTTWSDCYRNLTRRLRPSLLGSSWNLYLGEFFAKGSGLGRKNRKIEWHPKRHPRQHLGKLVINRKLLDTYLFFFPP